MKRFFITGIVLGLLQPIPAHPQSPQPGITDPPLVETLKVLVLEGEGATNVISTRTVTAPIVEVRDQNDRPVAGANVTFRSPMGGPGLTFPDQRTFRQFKTNAQGQTMAVGVIPNGQAGRFRIEVTAVLGSQMGHAEITQTNVSNGEQIRADRKSSRKKLWITLAAVVAGGAATGIVLATRGSTSAPSATTVVLNPGPITIGAPR